MGSPVECQGAKNKNLMDESALLPWRSEEKERARQAVKVPGRGCNDWRLGVAWDPLGGRRAEVLGVAPGDSDADYDLCALLLSDNDAMLGSGDASRTTSEEVRRVRLRAGRFVEAGPRTGSSPFLFVYGDDRVIHYTGADVDIGDAEDAQAMDSPFLFVYGDDRVTRYTGADDDTGDAEAVSYTHLDVYKRQLMYCLAALNLPLGDDAVSYTHLDVYKRQLMYCLAALNLPLGDDAVSYTHLDVYKRQLMYCLAALNLPLGDDAVSYTHLDVYKRQLISPFLFVYGDDRVTRYTGADDDTGDAEDAQATE
ncbi:hypothetical protein DEO72_LG3g1377 [Vigna unguiculata]|uniref:Uncharacterized protein n=1 Tax=Vigna unguiculata TaxID=3917 RepID=A0A4D6LE19_VIGUN|nr:hypothetical protein DEO72_LG3g1377 [Vigna unguiculata]